MEAQKLLNLPPEETKPTIVAKKTKIKSLIDISVETKKTSKKLRKVFEKGIYQKKTQLSVLTRYKKRLDSLEKRDESKQKRISEKKLTPQNSLPQFKSNFFSSGNDPLAAMAQLAAFKAFLNFGSGNILSALGQSLLAGGLMFGPSLIGGATKGLLRRPQVPGRGFDVTGRRASTSTQQRYLSRYGDKAFANRFGKDALKRTQQTTDAVSTATKGGKVAKAFGRFGAALIPGVGAVVGAADATLRAQAGDTTGSAIAGTAAALDAAAAASAATGIGLPVAGLLSVASFALDATNLIRDLSGISAKEEEKSKLVKPQETKIQERLKEQTEKQKEQTRVTGSTLSFKTTLVSYEKAIRKFEELASLFTISPAELTEGGSSQPPTPPGPQDTYDGQISGDQFYPLPGGSLSTRANGFPGGEYGAPRSYGGHSGQDIGGLPPGSPVVAWKTGKIRYAGSVESGDTILVIDHGNGLQSVYKHVVPTVPSGTVVYGGQQIATLFNTRKYAPHLHFEVWQNGAHKNPMQNIQSSQKISAPISPVRAKESHESSIRNSSPSQPNARPQSTPNASRPSTREQLRQIGIEMSSQTQNQPSPISSSIASNYIMGKSKDYDMSVPPSPSRVVNVPVQIPSSESPMMPTGQSVALNNSMNSEAILLKALMYKASA